MSKLLSLIAAAAAIGLAGCGYGTSDSEMKEAQQSQTPEEYNPSSADGRYDENDSCSADPACSAARETLEADEAAGRSTPGAQYDTNPYGDAALPTDAQEQAEIECFDSGRTDCVP